jgi:hypothetical protein
MVAWMAQSDAASWQAQPHDRPHPRNVESGEVAREFQRHRLGAIGRFQQIRARALACIDGVRPLGPRRRTIPALRQAYASNPARAQASRPREPVSDATTAPP